MTREPEKTGTGQNASRAAANGSSSLAVSHSAVPPLQLSSSENQQHEGLPGGLRSGIEQLSGFSMENVKVHYNSSAPAQLKAYAFSGQVTQRVEYPTDKLGSFDRVMLTVPDGVKGGLKEITGPQLQTEIIRRVRPSGEEKPGGFRLGTFAFEPGAFTRVKDPYPEKHGMPDLPKGFDVSSIDPLIKPLVLGTMADAGQLAYLIKNWISITRTHDVLIDVDCQFDRNGDVGFHKDSRGTTVFFNLTFSNQEEMQGPDFYPDTIGAPDLEEKLPAVVQSDIAERRAREKLEEQMAGKPADIESPKLPAWGRVSLSDANLYHSTPKMGHRNKAPLPPFDRANYIRLLTEMCIKEGNFGEFFNGQSNEQLQNWMITKSEMYNTHNSESVALKGQQDAMRDVAAKRTRRLSVDLEKGAISQEALDRQKLTPRTFIRTWIRMFPRPVETPMDEDRLPYASPMGYHGSPDKSGFNPNYPNLDLAF